ncbi:hypothetical protein RF11_09614 [Thelohanellus kitauei]|uniref:BZIP domain-containing protein n=1 Tax=Thelohanellus kitauei TaxID=669202 RepID=A0A0C2J9D4_THEKT|nr:hypothetical protein RF11_09614 [Thelohanellus kitauei]
MPIEILAKGTIFEVVSSVFPDEITSSCYIHAHCALVNAMSISVDGLEIRRQKNRSSSKASRERKRLEKKEMHQRITDLTSQNNQLRLYNENLVALVCQLVQERAKIISLSSGLGVGPFESDGLKNTQMWILLVPFAVLILLLIVSYASRPCVLQASQLELNHQRALVSHYFKFETIKSKILLTLISCCHQRNFHPPVTLFSPKNRPWIN